MNGIDAAGGVLWRDAAGGPEVALVHRPKRDDWSLPKGRAYPGEDPLLTACREVVEETGYLPRAVRRLPDTRYQVSVRGQLVPKIVRYWAMRVAAGEFTANGEVDALEWLPVPGALDRLSYPTDRAPVQEVAALPDADVTLLLVRHAKAEHTQPDADRALRASGREQAERLRLVLPCYLPARILTATPRRCRETVAPLAEALGRAVEDCPVVGEPEYGGDADAAVTLLRELAAAGTAAVLCGQGGTIPRVLTRLAYADGAPVPTLETATGSVHALTFTPAARCVAADYHRP
ncbi:MAG: NUDIX hydrolase [Mycobacteriales bacterium]